MPILILFFIIKSTTNIKVIRSRYIFKGWNYITITVYFFLGKISLFINIMSLCYFNTSGSVFFIDCIWLLKKVLTEKILKMATPLKVIGIEFSKHKLDKFVSISLYFLGTDSRNCLSHTYIYPKLYLVEGLKVNLLVSNNILATERMIIDLAKKTAMISNCQVTIFVITRPRYYPVQRKVLIDKPLMIFPESEALM